MSAVVDGAVVGLDPADAGERVPAEVAVGPLAALRDRGAGVGGERPRRDARLGGDASDNRRRRSHNRRRHNNHRRQL